MLKCSITTPHTLFNADAFTKEIIAGMNRTLTATKRDFGKTTATWNHKPKFEIEKARLQGDVVTGSVWTEDENYIRVCLGTKPRLIHARPGKKMKFKPKYSAKTRRGWIGSGASRRSGPTLYRSVIGTKKRHSIKARLFCSHIALSRAGEPKKIVLAALANVAGT